MKFLTNEQLNDVTERAMNSFMLALAQNDNTKMKQCQSLLDVLTKMSDDHA